MTRRISFLAAGTVAGALLLLVWSARYRIARGMIEDRLLAAHVPARYRMTRLGPFLARLEDVRIGPPAAPDLVADRIDVAIGYGPAGPFVKAIDAGGVRLRARIDANGLSLGVIDRLMPAAQGGQTTLPDLDLTIRDARVGLLTPNGAIRATVAGTGNPRRYFQGSATVASAMLRIASCRLGAVTAHLRLLARAGMPTVAGPVAIGSVACPGVALASGTTRISATSDAALQTVTARAAIAGFGGSAGPAHFAGLRARGTAVGRLGALDLDADIEGRALALPDVARRLAGQAMSPSGTPVAPTLARARAAALRLLGGTNARARVHAAIRGETVAARLHEAVLVGADGARVRVTERGGIYWSAAGWRADGDIATGGGALPALALALRQTAPGAPLDVAGTLETYRAADAAIAVAPLQAAWDRSRLRFAATARIDGPVGSGAVRGLTLPLRGSIARAGHIVIGAGCQPIAWRALRLGSVVLGPAGFVVCGRPALAWTADRRLRIAAETGPVALTGRTASGAAVRLAVAGASLTAQGFVVRALDAAVGGGDTPTRLAVPVLDGAFGADGVAGRFEGATGTIANVPLTLTAITGGWRLAGGTLGIDAALRVGDAGPAPRFHPLATDDATLRLDGNRITARADLVEPKSHAPVAAIDLAHDLATGSGHAALAVPGIHFAPKGLQPEALTPLTLGVVANVAGTITGEAHLAWGAGGVTSTGSFGTDRLDLAAAFGPVTGIRGTLRFTDLLALVSAPDQEATIAEINPGVAVTNGVVHYRLTGASRVRIDDATWPFAGGRLRLDPTTLDFGRDTERRLTFRIEGLDAAAFVQQLDFPNISASGRFDGALPMIFDQAGGRIAGGSIAARAGGGSIAYVGELSNARLGTMGTLAFDALKAIRYSSLDIGLDGRLDGEMISRVRFTGIREATPDQSIAARLIRNLPFRFNIEIRAPFRGLMGSARAYIDPRLLLARVPVAAPSPVQPSASGDRR